MDDRYARQRLLAGVGDPGQERICRATYTVARGDSLASEVEYEYLARAGAKHFVEPAASGSPFAHAAAFTNDTARGFAEGAWRALAQLRTALEQAP